MTREELLEKRWQRVKEYYELRYKADLKKRGLELNLNRPADETIDVLYKNIQKLSDDEFFYKEKIRP